jgi:hypothetical protein
MGRGKLQMDLRDWHGGEKEDSTQPYPALPKYPKEREYLGRGVIRASCITNIDNSIKNKGKARRAIRPFVWDGRQGLFSLLRSDG